MIELHPVGKARLLVGSKRGRLYGHDIITDKAGIARYCDDLSVVTDETVRACPQCYVKPAKFGDDDPCMAALPGVRNACCGHGKDVAYIEFDDGRVAIGDFQMAKRKA